MIGQAMAIVGDGGQSLNVTRVEYQPPHE